MRLYLILAALVAACQASHLVNIDGLPDCIVSTSRIQRIKNIVDS